MEQPVCELINVSKSYSDNLVLKDFNMKIDRGEMVAIIGRSGSGKTTLLNIIGMLENPDQGMVQIFGEPSPKANSSKATKMRRLRVAYLFQNFGLIDHATIDENLEIPLMYSGKTKKEKQALKYEALKKVGLNHPVHQKVASLSGGEQQRVAIARLFLKPFDLIIADEPTGSLDEYNREKILDLLRDFHKQNKTIIIVTHDSFVANICERTIHLASPNNIS